MFKELLLCGSSFFIVKLYKRHADFLFRFNKNQKGILNNLANG